jgi:hypothetical protein
LSAVPTKPHEAGRPVALAVVVYAKDENRVAEFYRRTPSLEVSEREDTAVKASFLVDSFEAVREAAAATGGGLGPLEAAWTWRGSVHLDGHDHEGNVVQFRLRAR